MLRAPNGRFVSAKSECATADVRGIGNGRLVAIVQGRIFDICQLKLNRWKLAEINRATGDGYLVDIFTNPCRAIDAAERLAS